MNRFLARRKEKAEENGSAKKKGKKNQPEPEPKLDLAMVLPPADDFRTSLIMPSLSTRFSMLKEQDDPNSKIGKASDDSVLLPKRQSRLHEFGFMSAGLSDIAEVSSLHGSVRPPFANERHGSFDSGNTDDTANMMSRARPGEGNVLFGGRQKIYKISNNASAKGMGNHLYDDDVQLSAFQKFRLEERERLRGQGLDVEDLPAEPVSPTKELSYSPSLSGSLNRRETTSSTNSGTANARISTAATSIASQGTSAVPAPLSTHHPSSTAPASPIEPFRNGTKGRRLYDQALEQHMHDQQSSALNRLNSIQRTQAPTGRSTPPLFSQTRSATNLNDRFNRTTPFRTDSPVSPIFTGKDAPSAASSPITSRPQSPPLVSPLGSDSDDAQTLNSALQPNDRGKATAMGAFNKPKQAFSEHQYAERMKHLQQEQEASVPKLDKPRKLSLRERAELEQRKRIDAMENEKTQSPSPFSVFQTAANQMKISTTTPPGLPPNPRAPPSQDMQSPDSQRGTTFFTSADNSDDEGDSAKSIIAKPRDLDRRLQNLPTATGPAPSIFEHPALRSRNNSHGTNSEHPAMRSRSTSRAVPEITPIIDHSNDKSSVVDAVTKVEKADVDSPTLGPDNGGLSGLIRQHLRNVSNVSSDYGDSNQITMSPPPTSTTASLSLQIQNAAPQTRQPVSDFGTPGHSSYSYSNPWDLDDLDNSYYGEGESTSSVSPVDQHKSKLKELNINVVPSDPEALRETVAEWESQMKKTHKREPSADERDAFHRELILRQRAIQDSLRNNKTHQDHGRHVHPAPSSGGLKQALNMLRAKSSRESFATVNEKYEPSGKAARLLGISTGSANASSASLAGTFGESTRSEERHPHEAPTRQKPSRVLQQSEQDAQRELEHRQRSVTDDHRANGRSTTASSDSSTRGRSSSELSSGRSRSRPAQHRDDAEQSMTEGAGSRSTTYSTNTTPSIPGYAANATQPVTERPSLDSQGRLRSRSNSRTAASSYFESKHLAPIHTIKGAVDGPSSRLSPGLPTSPRPSPGASSPNVNGFRSSPYSATNTPPVSGTSTPVVTSFNATAGAGAIIPSTNTLRKKSIAKANISEPIFLSTTSVIDTVNLPAGASLRNGMEAAPPVPPINPMRRRFGFGRSATDEPSMQPPNSPFAATMRTNSSDALAGQDSQAHPRLRKISSEGRSLHGKAQAAASPAIPAGGFVIRNGSPPRPINGQHVAQKNMDGAMF
jgi:hypothetical protein